MTLFRETPCEHDWLERHLIESKSDPHYLGSCPGGSRVEVGVDWNIDFCTKHHKELAMVITDGGNLCIEAVMERLPSGSCEFQTMLLVDAALRER